MFTSLIHRLSKLSYQDGSPNAQRVMILVGAIELATQARNTIKRRFPDLASRTRLAAHYRPRQRSG